MLMKVLELGLLTMNVTGLWEASEDILQWTARKWLNGQIVASFTKCMLYISRMVSFCCYITTKCSPQIDKWGHFTALRGSVYVINFMLHGNKAWPVKKNEIRLLLQWRCRVRAFPSRANCFTLPRYSEAVAQHSLFALPLCLLLLRWCWPGSHCATLANIPSFQLQGGPKIGTIFCTP